MALEPELESQWGTVGGRQLQRPHSDLGLHSTPLSNGTRPAAFYSAVSRVCPQTISGAQFELTECMGVVAMSAIAVPW